MYMCSSDYIFNSNRIVGHSCQYYWFDSSTVSRWTFSFTFMSFKELGCWLSFLVRLSSNSPDFTWPNFQINHLQFYCKIIFSLIYWKCNSAIIVLCLCLKNLYNLISALLFYFLIYKIIILKRVSKKLLLIYVKKVI